MKRPLLAILLVASLLALMLAHVSSASACSACDMPQLAGADLVVALGLPQVNGDTFVASHIGDVVARASNPWVYITKTGKKYHRKGCQCLRKSKIKIRLKDAKARGYKPCKVCNPPR